MPLNRGGAVSFVFDTYRLLLVGLIILTLVDWRSSEVS